MKGNFKHEKVLYVCNYVYALLHKSSYIQDHFTREEHNNIFLNFHTIPKWRREEKYISWWDQNIHILSLQWPFRIYTITSLKEEEF